MSRPARRGRLVLTAMLLVMLPLSATFTRSPAAADDETAAPTLVVSLSSLQPVAPQPGQTVVLTGTIRNSTFSTVSNVTVGLRMSGTALGTKGEFDQYADNPTGDVTTTLPSVTLPAPPAPIVRLLPQAAHSFQISVPVDSLGLPATWQVRELAVVATATTTTGLTDTGTLRTFLPWAPRSVASPPVQLAWVWPIVDRPHRGYGSTWLDNDLSGELSGRGRLAQLVAAANAVEHPAPRTVGRHHRKVARPGVPVTWALDPLLVEDATLMSKGYTVRGSNTTAEVAAGRTAAASWLTALHGGVDNAEVIPLPYADTDLVAAVRAGLSGEVSVATASGRNLLTRALPTARLLTTAWPLDGLADQRTLDRMFGMGISSVLLSDAALPIIGGQPPETPSAHTTITTGNGELQAVLADSTLSDAVDQGATDPTGARLDLQRFLAETLMIQAEFPNDPRSLVVAPDQRWQPTASYARTLLADTGGVPWIKPVQLSTVLASPVYTKVTRGPISYPTTARRAELRPSYLHQVRTLKDELVSFGTVLTAGTSTVAGYDSAIQRLLSSGYRGDVPARQAALDSVKTNLQDQMSKVSITTHPRSFITLTSHKGSLPITISNRLDTPVHVILQVDANQRLGLVNGGRTTVPTIPANTSVSVTVRATAKTSGVFPLEVRLLTPGMHKYGGTVQVFVRSTAYGTITLVITAAATFVLLVAVVIRLTRRGIAARRTARAET